LHALQLDQTKRTKSDRDDEMDEMQRLQNNGTIRRLETRMAAHLATSGAGNSNGSMDAVAIQTSPVTPPSAGAAGPAAEAAPMWMKQRLSWEDEQEEEQEEARDIPVPRVELATPLSGRLSPARLDGPPVNIYLIRHGQAQHNVTQDHLIRDPLLTALGEKQARALHGTLPRMDVIISSPLRRTLQTTLFAFSDQLAASVPLS